MMSISEWGLYPEGNYKFRCSDVSVETGQKSNYVQWYLEILEPGDYAGESIIQIVNLSTHRYSRQILGAWLVAFGCDPEDDPDVENKESFTAYLKKNCVGNVAYGFLGKKVDSYGAKNVIKPPEGIFKSEGKTEVPNF